MTFKEEIIEYENYDNNELYIKKVGNVPVIFTAVHTMEQIRQDGTLKFSEPFTKAVALYLSNHIDTSYYIKLRDTGVDSNSKIEDEFKKELLDIIRKNNIKLLIDLHGARADRPFDVELGTLNHLTADFSTIKALEDSFKENGVFNVAFNDPFKGGGITQYIYQNTDIDIVQIEINQKFRDSNNVDNIEKICNSLLAFVKVYSNFN